ncbi:MAG: LCP family protein [Lachnospiraceae bacterium]|nr:LCP family protein [Lachnospiraceae bacterium]
MNKKIAIALVVLVVFLLAGGIGYMAAIQQKPKVVSTKPSTQTAEEETQEEGLTMAYDGDTYEYNRSIKTILFLGVDKQEEVTIQESAGHGGQSDTMILFLMNTEDETTTMLEISRNSMIGVDIYDMSGKYFATENAQICLQYAYGDGEKKSCWLTKKKVGELFEDKINIDGYLSLNVEGIAVLNDAIGGVTLTVPEDYTEYNPKFQKGATLTLTGEEAEQYVRKRDINRVGENEKRMERQDQYLQALFNQMYGKVNSDTVENLMNVAEPYMVTDLSLQEMQMMANYNLQEKDYEVPGQIQQGAGHDEYLVNYEELEKLTRNLFYNKAEK